MVRATVGRRLLVAGLLVFLAAVAFLFATGHVLIQRSEDYASGQLWSFWLPVLLGLLLIRVAPWRTPDGTAPADMLRGRRARREVWALLGCVAAFFVGDLVLYGAYDLVDPQLRALAYHTSKVLFLLLLPIMLTGRSGVMGASSQPDVLQRGTRVPWGWRWAGVLAVVGYVYIAVLIPWTTPAPSPGTLPNSYTLFARLALALVTAALLEEVFFRALLQTRLEYLLGRWPGIVVSAGVYAVASLVGTDAYHSLVVDLAMAIAVQGTAGVLFGYLWTRYRNLWLNFLLHACVSVVAVMHPVIYNALVFGR
ncbi:CPBP family intramembrane glutamic endopeptidase [Marinitenerispora sediminis]|uniref:CAAX protease family protein n=1 Tax=Marinitenerispora sediminis TaxID=1931232 RepID=A0A368SZ12_9ACTN|nr:CPBP family intramembrane glutamic endopeptidase [Marinitenerispora sediminis]RCV48093.1 CAAX protease family protein [Marinitenerispora sediminis]RCV48467.1 CAAX protease family protein [Marinitenerispora sediminis]RCV50277.1 CAAX protease family protein [Marinitenerispora sediminis]